MKGIFVTSTGTEIGKTSISVLILRGWLEAGHDVRYWKPVASGCEESRYGYRSPDELEAIETAGLPEEAVHATYRFDAPRSPDVAAQMEGRAVEVPPLLDEYHALRQESDRLVVEGIGGVAVPFQTGGIDVADFITTLELSCLMVVDPELGTISHTRSALTHLKSAGGEDLLSGIVITPGRGRSIERVNRDHLEKLVPGVPVQIIPRYDVHDSPRFVAELGKGLLEALDADDSQHT